MIASLPVGQHLTESYRTFLDALPRAGFRGEIRTDYGARLSAATDNSVYQLVPQAVVFPRDEADVVTLTSLLGHSRFRSVKLSPRGGGTGTNGQSLCDGIMVDVSRHMAQILEVNLEESWVRVQPGVVLDELNARLAPHRVFFAPNLSPSSRATLGGMIATDASGKGSRIYGKTSEHVLELRAVLGDGTVLETRPLSPADFEAQAARSDRVGQVHRDVAEIARKSQEAVQRVLPRLERFMTGYDLEHVCTSDGGIDLTRIITGSEGTLAFVTEAKLKLTPIVRHKRLLAIRYREFDDALRAAAELVETNPGAIETVDDTIVSLAKSDVIWNAVAHLLEAPLEPELRAVNLVEFEASDETVVIEKARALMAALDQERGKPGRALGYTLATKPADIAALWGLRKKGVGLLGNARGERRPVPFVEDTAVPPEKLADYIREFRALLDRHGLTYGMFGHVDVGCLHVRPALDMRQASDEVLLRTISDGVVSLVKKYGGVLWGEHGRGYRSEYTPSFFGAELYEALRAVKAAFDPHNQLNPGKLATPSRSKDRLVSVDAVKRGHFDRQIRSELAISYDPVVYCNGNGQCFDWNPDSVMCPSSKVTRDRIHSPKGRAGILREWLRLVSRTPDAKAVALAAPGAELFRGRAADASDFSHEVYDAMNGCLACKACATDCPVHVDIPALRAQFFEQYHGRYRRPLKDYFVFFLEKVLRLLALWPKLSNGLMGHAVSRRFLSWVGIVDTPLLSERTLARGLAERGHLPFDAAEIRRMASSERERVVLVAQDAFTTYYEPNVALAVCDLLARLGRTVRVLPILENGKGLHVKGFLSAFNAVARRNAEYLEGVAALGLPIVGVEPAVTLTYRDEYRHALGRDPGFRVELVQEYLARELPRLREELGANFPHVPVPSEVTPRLFGHCTEKTAVPRSQAAWRVVFEALGVPVELESTGCCGMCGVFGHEAAHLDESRGIFEMSWKKHLPETERGREAVLATGHSCRSQVKRFAGFLPKHPAEALVLGLEGSSS